VPLPALSLSGEAGTAGGPPAGTLVGREDGRAARGPSRLNADVALALLLFGAAFAYLSSLPHSLNGTDESYFLYEAKRIRDGEVMYRDFFQYVTPLSSYAMAGLYWLFGTSIATAHGGMAAVNAAAAVILYGVARRMGVRREIAVLVPLAQVAIGNSTFPYASWHWFSTFWTALLLFVFVPGDWGERPRRAVLPGIVAGLLIGTQQQRGAPVAVGAYAVLLLDHVIDRRYAGVWQWRALAMRLLYFSAGMALILVPVLALFVVMSGPQAMYIALVQFPLVNYRSHYRTTWGALSVQASGFATYTLPRVLTWSPLATLLPTLEGAGQVWRGVERRRVRSLTTLVVLSIFCALSIWYFPGLAHVAFIAGGFWVCAAVGAEWMLSALGRLRWTRMAGVTAAAAVGVILVAHLVSYARMLWRQYPFPGETAFGRVDFSAEWEVAFVDSVRALLRESHAEEIFSYPPFSSPYLTLGVHNATRYQHFDAIVFPPQQTHEVLSVLRQRPVPYVVMYWFFARPRDPVIQFIKEHYDPVRLPALSAYGSSAPALYRRKGLAGSADGNGGAAEPQGDAGGGASSRGGASLGGGSSGVASAGR